MHVFLWYMTVAHVPKHDYRVFMKQVRDEANQ